MSTRQREPYTVEELPEVRGMVTLVGYDGHAAPCIEVHVAPEDAGEDMVQRILDWIDWRDARRGITPRARPRLMIV